MTDFSKHGSQDVVADILAGYQKGVESGARDLCPGNYFDGAFGAAVRAGLNRGTVAYDAFVDGFLQVVKDRYPRGITTDADGIIC